MWTTMVICFVVWFLMGRPTKRLLGESKDKVDNVVGCCTGVLFLLSFLGGLTLGLIKLIGWINS